MRAKRQKRLQRHRRVRAKIKGTGERPRLSVFRSNKHLWVQLIDDTRGVTIAAANDAEVNSALERSAIKSGTKEKGTRAARAESLGMIIAARAKEKKIKQAVFDRGGHSYHGLVKAVAEGARKEGLKF